MRGVGFEQSQFSPSIYYHRRRSLRTLVHGDDFMTTGQREDAEWFKRELNKRFSVSATVVGNGDDEVREARLLGRLVRWTEQGWEAEADLRHAQLLVQGMKLETAKGVKSPGEDPKPWEEDEDRQPLRGREVTEFRALAARANYLALDRPDIAFSAKECCRGMAAPTVGDQRRLRRLARYLITCPRVVWCFAWQDSESEVNVFTDSDWAGCRRTARSTSGGVLCRGSHCLRAYSATQKNVTLSSGEAELMAIVRASAEGIGLAQLALSWGLELQAHIWTDSSAALAVTQRKGNGKLRHVRIGHLWVQEASEEGRVVYSKIRGGSNPADMLTKALQGPRIADLMSRVALEPREGSGELQLQLHRVSTSHGPDQSAGRPLGQQPARGGVSGDGHGLVVGQRADSDDVTRAAAISGPKTHHLLALAIHARRTSSRVDLGGRIRSGGDIGGEGLLPGLELGPKHGSGAEDYPRAAR